MVVTLSAILSLLFFFTNTQSAPTNKQQQFLKLPLLHKTPFASPTQTLAADNHRLSLLSLRRKPNPSSITSPVVSGASSGSGQYFVDLKIGSPPQSLLLVVDTGSDLVWVKCSACRNCSLHEPGSVFAARHSSTFSPLHCYNPVCKLVPHPDPGCNLTRIHSPCRYEYEYADGSLTAGIFSRETATFSSTMTKHSKLKNLAFGCGFRISGPSVTGASFNGAHGVMGLGRGPISFSSQLGRRYGNKFSYCLMDYTFSPPPTSYLVIGGRNTSAKSSHRRMSFSPLLFNSLSPTFYYIGIKTVSVDGLKLPINSSVWSIDSAGNGGTIIDSGTTLSFIPEPAYRQILTAMRRRLKLPSSAVPTPGFDLCVDVSGVDTPKFPRIKFKLEGGAVFAPPPRNYFIETENKLQCLAIQPVSLNSGISVIGNLMQQGFLFEFDEDNSRLGFSRRGCALT